VGYPGHPPDHKRCRATAKLTGERCLRYANRGGRVCYLHGGRAPQVQRKARERLAFREAAKAMRQHHQVEERIIKQIERGA
jgi:hypothetical protein